LTTRRGDREAARGADHCAGLPARAVCGPGRLRLLWGHSRAGGLQCESPLAALQGADAGQLVAALRPVRQPERGGGGGVWARGPPPRAPGGVSSLRDPGGHAGAPPHLDQHRAVQCRGRSPGSGGLPAALLRRRPFRAPGGAPGALGPGGRAGDRLVGPDLQPAGRNTGLRRRSAVRGGRPGSVPVPAAESAAGGDLRRRAAHDPAAGRVERAPEERVLEPVHPGGAAHRFLPPRPAGVPVSAGAGCRHSRPDLAFTGRLPRRRAPSPGGAPVLPVPSLLEAGPSAAGREGHAPPAAAPFSPPGAAALGPPGRRWLCGAGGCPGGLRAAAHRRAVRAHAGVSLAGRGTAGHPRNRPCGTRRAARSVLLALRGGRRRAGAPHPPASQGPHGGAGSGPGRP
jgi:hypothetical protein